MSSTDPREYVILPEITSLQNELANLKMEMTSLCNELKPLTSESTDNKSQETIETIKFLRVTILEKQKKIIAKQREITSRSRLKLEEIIKLSKKQRTAESSSDSSVSSWMSSIDINSAKNEHWLKIRGNMISLDDLFPNNIYRHGDHLLNIISQNVKDVIQTWNTSKDEFQSSFTSTVTKIYKSEQVAASNITYLYTHDEKILGRQRPDFIIVDSPIPNQKPLPTSIISIGELKLYSGDLFIRDAGIRAHRYAIEILKRTSRNSVNIFCISSASIFALKFSLKNSSSLECVHTCEYPWNDIEAILLLAFMLFPPLHQLSTIYDYRALKIQGFKLKNFLGHGATSNVYEIEDNEGERFAFKFSKGTSETIQHEVEILEQLGQTHYPITVREKFELKEDQYVPTSNGDNLIGFTIYPVCKRFPSDWRHTRTRSLFNCIQKLHKLGYVHRDISPSNILQCPITNKLVLIDFGFAVKVGTKCSYSGTLQFASDDILIKLSFNRKREICAKYIDDWISFSYIVISLLYPDFRKLDHSSMALYDFFRMRKDSLPENYSMIMRCWFNKYEREQLEFEDFIVQLTPFFYC